MSPKFPSSDNTLNYQVVDILRNDWFALCRRIDAKNPEVIWEWLEAAYTEPQRYYHTLNHINHCLNELYTLEKKYPPEVELAIWFHDIIYDTMSKDNEERSADIATNALGVMQLPSGFLQVVQSMILESKHIEVKRSTEEADIFIDIDLAILGQTSEIYDEFEKQIRKEYEWVPLDMYCAGRISILERFLSSPNVYRTKVFREKYEQQARVNLERVIQTLRDKKV